VSDVRARLARAVIYELFDEAGREEHALRVADKLLALPGLAIVELPEPDPDIGSYFDAGCGAIAHVSAGDVRLHSTAWISGPHGGIYRSPNKARELAAALLAAAKAAEPA
jgi:hypothetical protein